MKNKKDLKPKISNEKRKSKAMIPSIGSKHYLMLFGILLLTFIAYFPVLKNGFVNWDDNEYIYSSSLIQTINLKEFFTHYNISNYHPLTMLFYAIEYHFFALNPVGYHAVNLVIHLFNILLVFYAIYLLINKVELALIVALLFGIHPMHVESVAWASELKDVLYSFFFLGSYIYYLKYLKSSSHKLYLFSLILFLLSLLSKAMATSLPLVLLLTDYFLMKDSTGIKGLLKGKYLLNKVPFFALSMAFGIIAVYAQKTSGAIAETTVFPFPQSIIFACYGFIVYLFKSLLPFNLSAFYPYPMKSSEAIPLEYYLYIVVLIALVAVIFYSLRYTKKILFGTGFFIATILLVLQILPVGEAMMADRYYYIPSIGIIYLMAEGSFWIWNKKYKVPALILLSIITLFFSINTYSRCGVWFNGMTLWNDVISHYQTVPGAYNNRGNLLMDENKYDAAINDFNKALELNPKYPEAHNNRGKLLMDKNKYDEALIDLNKAIEQRLIYPIAHNNRGNLFTATNKFDDALNDYNQAIAQDSEYITAYCNRANLFLKMKRFDDAMKDYNRAIDINPNYLEAYNNRGILYTNEQKYDDAINDFNKAIKINPDYPEAWFNMGIADADEKKQEEAINDYSKAIHLKPGYIEAYENRGNIFINEKKYDEAINDFNKAIALNPGFALSYNNRGNAFLNQKKYEEAIKDFSKAIECNPNYAKAYYNRGSAKYYSNNKQGACADLQKAASLGYAPGVEFYNKSCR